MSDHVSKSQNEVRSKPDVQSHEQELAPTSLSPHLLAQSLSSAATPSKHTAPTRSTNIQASSIVQLQRFIGNRGIQKILNKTPPSGAVQRRSESVNLGGPHGGWGNEQGMNNSNMVFNPHATLYINGRAIQSVWYPNNPDVTTDTFHVTPNSRGTVRMIVDTWWFQDNSVQDINGTGQAIVDFDFSVDATGQITLGNTLPIVNSQGDAATLSITANPASANGTTATLALVAQITAAEDLGLSSSTGISAGIASTEQGVSRSFSGGLVRSRSYGITLVASTPTQQTSAVRGQVERNHSVLFATNRPRQNEPIDHVLSNQQYQSLVGFMGHLNSDTLNEVRQGQRPVTILGRASSAGGVSLHNQNLSHRRAEAVKGVLRQLFPQIQFSDASGAVGAIGTLPATGDAQGDRVVEIRVMELQSQAGGH